MELVKIGQTVKTKKLWEGFGFTTTPSFLIDFDIWILKKQIEAFKVHWLLQYYKRGKFK